MDLKILHVSCRPKASVYFNGFPGFSIRSMLGLSLKQLEHGKYAEESLPCSWEDCAFCRVFRGAKSGGRTGWILSGVPKQTVFTRDDSISFRIVLLGRNVKFAAKFAAAAQGLKETGLGYAAPKGGKKGPGQLSDVVVSNAFDQLFESTSTPDSLHHLFHPQTYENAQSLTVNVQTPIRITLTGTKNKHITHNILTPLRFVLHLVERVRWALGENYFNKIFPVDLADRLEKECKKVKIEWLPDVSFPTGYFQSRHGNRISLSGGIRRSFHFTGNLEQSMPFLMLGTLLHAGTPASYGMGEYSLSRDDLLPTKKSLLNAWEVIRKRVNLEREGLDEPTLIKQLKAIPRQILSENYVPNPSTLYMIRGGRQLRIPSLQDRILQRTVVDSLGHYVDAVLSDRCYGFRNGKGPVKAIRRVLHEIHQRKNHYAVTVDIDQFFDSIDPELLWKKLVRFPLPSPLLNLLMLWIRSGGFYRNQLHWRDPERGIPQGGVISPLLSNIYLNDFDHHLAGLSVQSLHIRYCDDILMLGKSLDDVRSLVETCESTLLREYGLRLNDKPVITNLAQDSVDYLGISIGKGHLSMAIKKKEEKAEFLAQLIMEKNSARTQRQAIEDKLQKWRRYYGTLLGEDLESVLKEIIDAAIAKNPDHPHNSLLIEFRPVIKKIPAKEPPAPFEKSRTVEERLKIAKREAIHTARIKANLILDTPGRYLGKRKSRIVVLEDGRQVHTVSARDLEQVFITTRGISLSTNVIELLSRHRIPVTFLDFSGQPHAILTPFHQPKAELVIQQARLSKQRSLHIAATIISSKLKNQNHLLRYWLKSRSTSPAAESLASNASMIAELHERLKTKLRSEEYRWTPEGLRQIEAQAAAHYWSAFKTVLKGYSFPGRKHQEAKDTVNQCLNYGYGFLYAKANIALLRAGLNPYLGLLHATGRGRPALTFDFVESFRQPMIDREVVAMLNKGKPVDMDKGRLADSSRRRMIEQMSIAFARVEERSGEMLTRDQLIRLNARELAKAVMTDEDFTPYIMVHW